MRALLLVLIFSSCTLAPDLKDKAIITTNQKKISYRFVERWANFSEKDGRNINYIYNNVQKEIYFNMTSHIRILLPGFIPNSQLKYHAIDKPQLELVVNPYEVPLLRPGLLALDGSDYYIDFILGSPRNMIDQEKTTVGLFAWILSSVLTLTIIPAPEYTWVQLRAIVYDKNFNVVKQYVSDEKIKLWIWLPYAFMKDSKVIGPKSRVPTFDNAMNKLILQMENDHIFENKVIKI